VGQELLVNGDFETLAVTGTPPMPTRDAYGNAVPVDWFRSTGPASGPPAVPYTELISPLNGDAADDSDGIGTNSVALNTSDQASHADWRSEAFATTPGEELFWSFDFKFEDYVDTNPTLMLNSPEGFRIELRSFENMTPGGSTADPFAGEQTVWVYVHGYGPDTNGDGLGDSGGFATGGGYPSPPENVTVMNFNDGQWHTLSSDIFGDQDAMDDNNLWRIPSVNAGNTTDGNFADLRVSVNAFNFVYTSDFQLRIDNVSVRRPTEGLPGDYNENGTVDAADYVAWRENLNQSVTLPNDPTPGMVTQEDHAVWRANFGVAAATSSFVDTRAVPEPGLLAVCALPVALLASSRTRRKLHCLLNDRSAAH
jgi:hypothetical protein